MLMYMKYSSLPLYINSFHKLIVEAPTVHVESIVMTAADVCTSVDLFCIRL